MSTAGKLHGEADRLRRAIEQNVDTEKLREKLDLSHFDFNAVLRGMQLTLVGGEFPGARAG
ncbi:hypothetical protein TOPH_04446 [Tolypocladium ophioglossoides CBS 100239]|uniref:Uncharacterized protein n=1 Tax=Tolypocladium ophioglossoides (strain CBS 100239) TaxID=1163406 RepID=A0A0L0N9R1_TOLOC|nr:hypothetical protein TOPH_04446 [Tolypocladium ophioglossoides CBS 100239]